MLVNFAGKVCVLPLVTDPKLMLDGLTVSAPGITAVAVSGTARLAFVALDAMDRLPFFQSLGRSFSLVRRNFVHFLVFAIIFAMLGVGSVVASIYACCFSFILMPVLAVFFALLSRVTLLKMKLAVEKQEGRK